MDNLESSKFHSPDAELAEEVAPSQNEPGFKSDDVGLPIPASTPRGSYFGDSWCQARRLLQQRIHHLWHGLPKAAKAASVLVIISTVLLIAYSITAVSLRSYDEEAHIATVIIVRRDVNSSLCLLSSKPLVLSFQRCLHSFIGADYVYIHPICYL